MQTELVAITGARRALTPASLASGLLRYMTATAATAHPAFVDELGGSLQDKNIYAEARVVVDREVVTSRGPGTALEWALCLVERLYGTEHCKKIAGPMVVQPANARIRNQLEWRLDEAPLQ